MSTKILNCIFCMETFESREELQVHFRKHGDPNLHASLKGIKKERHQVAGGPRKVSPASARSQRHFVAEEVSCDVCPEKFTAVAKAITHKHRFHPDYHIKHFCCWCGKYFPIKHLFDKHKSAHAPAPAPDEVLRCDDCCFDFYTLTALSYHNRSYHRADAPTSHLVGSRKFKLVNKELVRVYFCFLCGKEFINCYNLQKHLSELHAGDDWCEPGTDVLRCPRCEVLFHSQTSYVTHLAYHTNDEIYVHTKETYPELQEFTLETLPPIIETMEAALPSDLDNLLSVDLDLSAVEMSSDLMNPSTSSDTNEMAEENAPRKSITLDQFLSMNKDVFGEVFNFQGVEEVPSRVVANQLKRRKPQQAVRPGTKIVSAQNLQKLKDQGVVVHVKKPSNKQNIGNRMTIPNGLAIGRPIKVAPSAYQGMRQPGPARPALMKVIRPVGVHSPSPRPVNKALKIASNVQSSAPRGPVANPRAPMTNPRGPVLNPRVSVTNPRAPISNPRAALANSRVPAPSIRSAVPNPRNPVPNPRMTISNPRTAAPNPKAPLQIKNPLVETPGPFSCFKKPKESLIPISDVPDISELLKPDINVSPLPTSSKSLSMSVPSVSQNKNIAPAAPTVDSSKNKTDEALQKLQRQGLLVKKPKRDEPLDSTSKTEAPCLTVKGGG